MLLNDEVSATNFADGFERLMIDNNILLTEYKGVTHYEKEILSLLDWYLLEFAMYVEDEHNRKEDPEFFYGPVQLKLNAKTLAVRLVEVNSRFHNHPNPD
jgi:hypothetical protein